MRRVNTSYEEIIWKRNKTYPYRLLANIDTVLSDVGTIKMKNKE